MNATSMPASARRVENVAVVVDGWNLLLSAQDLLPFGAELRTVNMGKVGDTIAAKRNRPSAMVELHVVLGVVSRGVDEVGHLRQMRMVKGWERDSRVTVDVRTLAYDPQTGHNREKGVDTEISLLTRDLQVARTFDTVVLFSGDRDFDPLVQRAVAAKKPSDAHFELARWECQRGGPWVHGASLWCHYLTAVDYRQCSIAAPRGFAA